MWARVKRAYVKAPRPLRWAVLIAAFTRLWGPTSLATHALQAAQIVEGVWARAGRPGNEPLARRGDWVGGYPFEVATPEEIFDFARERDFELLKLKTCGGGLGCNEFVFARRPAIQRT